MIKNIIVLIKQHYICKHNFECMDFDNGVYRCEKCEKWTGLYNNNDIVVEDYTFKEEILRLFNNKIKR